MSDSHASHAPESSGADRVLGYSLLLGYSPLIRVVIAAHALRDKCVVSTLLVPPMVLDRGNDPGRATVPLPVALW